jgi:hypothetical protein
MPNIEKRKYKRRKLNDKEIQTLMEKWLEVGPPPRGVRAHVWKWLKDDRDGLARSIENYERLRVRERSALIDRMEFEVRVFVIRRILSAAQLTLRDYSRPFSVRYFTRPQLLTCIALRLFMDKSHRCIALHLERQAPERLLIFGRTLNLPAAPTYRTFEQRLSDDDFETFLKHLKKTNPVAASLIRLRHEMKGA